MEEKIYQILNNIMQMTHSIVGDLISQTQMEIERKKSKINEDKMLEKQFENLHQKYMELRDALNGYKRELNNGYGEALGILKTMDKNPERNELYILEARNLVIDYIKYSYSSMEFINDDDVGITSIYEEKPFAEFRDIEYNMYLENINSLENKEDIESVDNGQYGFFESGKILNYLSYKKAYKKVYKKICKVIDLIEKEDLRFQFSSEAEKERIRKKLIMIKYLEKYIMLNQRYNGLVTKDLKGYKAITLAQENNSLDLLLGVSKEDIKLKEDSIIEKCDQALKGDILDVFKSERDKRSKIRLFRRKETTTKKVDVKKKTEQNETENLDYLSR